MKKGLRILVAALLMFSMLLGCISLASAEDDKFYIYSFGTDMETYLALVYERYPELQGKLVYVNCGASDTFQEKIDALLKTTDAQDYPDMFCLEGGFIMKYTNSEYTMSIKDVGLTDEDIANMYPYMLDLSKDPTTGEYKAVSWQACPGAFYYNSAVAEKYLGIKTPEEMEAAISGWDNFMATARKLNEASAGTCKILSSNDDVYYLFMSNKTSTWVDENGLFHYDEMMTRYMETVKTLVDEKLTWNTGSWGQEWYASMNNGDVLGYFGPTWFSNGVMEGNVTETYGQWRICKPTVPYYWGGTWCAASNKCGDTEIARKIMTTLTCDTEWMTKMAENYGEFPNNKLAVKNMVDNGKSGKALLGGQDFYGFFGEMAQNVDVSFVSGFDTKACELLKPQVSACANGEKSIEQAIMDFEDAFAEAFPTVKFE